MNFPATRLRRLRKNKEIRDILSEVNFSINDVVLPFFITEGTDITNPILSMPGVYQFSIDRLMQQIKNAINLGIKAVILFGIPDAKDNLGTGAYHENGIIQRAVKEIKEKYPDLIVITDVCLCEYTDHGHCGIINEQGIVLNDATLELLAKTAVSHAKAGADIVAPSDMMDGRVGAIRKELDKEGLTDIIIMSYSVKYASGFYGPFRDAAGSAPQFGDRSTYQMHINSGIRQALNEVFQDINEGADIVMVKPALAYLDIIKTVKENVLCPVASYNVSGEYSMIKAAAEKGWLDERKTVLELMSGLKRAGSDFIITYHALDIAKWFINNE